jgi:hypothetical protein
VSGTTLTARDIGASVLLSAGTGTGQLDFTAGVVKASLAQILGTAITGTAAQLAAAFTKFFDKAAPTGTINSFPDVVPGAAGGLFIAGTNAATVVTTSLTTTFTGNLTGSVGSVTGAVGSVTGNVGGNVTGSVGSVVGAVGSVTGAVGSVSGNVAGNVTGSVGSLAAAAKADVNAEVVDALSVDVYTEPGQGAPGVSLSLVAKVGYLYKFMRNKITQTSTTLSVFADDTTTVDQKATVSDDGSTYTRSEISTGP